MIGSYTQTWNAHLCRLQVVAGERGRGEGTHATAGHGHLLAVRNFGLALYSAPIRTVLALDLSPGLSFLGLSDSLAQPLQALSLFGQPTTSLESLQTDAGGTYTGLPNT